MKLQDKNFINDLKMDGEHKASAVKNLTCVFAGVQYRWANGEP